MSRKNQDFRIQPPVTAAAEKAELLIRGLQNRLAESGGEVRLDDPAENLDLELEGYFAAEESTQVSALSSARNMRKRIVDGVAEKVLNSCDWSQDGQLSPQFENEVIERIVERVFERLAQGALPERQQRGLAEPVRSPARQLRATQYRA